MEKVNPKDGAFNGPLSLHDPLHLLPWVRHPATPAIVYVPINGVRHRITYWPSELWEALAAADRPGDVYPEEHGLGWLEIVPARV
jgi:hypothetical protein